MSLIRGLAAAWLVVPAVLASTTQSVAPGGTHMLATQRSWLIGETQLASLKQMDPVTAAKFRDRANGYVTGQPPAGWPTRQVRHYQSYRVFHHNSTPRPWVLYDPEKWPGTPRAEQHHPDYYMRLFVRLAHRRGKRVILAPALDLVRVSTAACHRKPGEATSHAYLRCRYAAAAAKSGADVYEIQAQTLQAPGASVYGAFVRAAAAQARATRPGQVIWAGLTTDRRDSAAMIYRCYRAVKGYVGGWWMNTSPSTLAAADTFLSMIAGGPAPLARQPHRMPASGAGTGGLLLW
ncbi:MAG: hypothetical protein J2P34_01900 [Actinobacteria bacterium]|nr:hypothetical protein [Actinomycetota bacterium]